MRAVSDTTESKCLRGGQQGAQRTAKLRKMLLLLKDRPGLEMRKKQWGASQKETTEGARERDNNNRTRSSSLSSPCYSLCATERQF